jgi:hypothetical protein
MNKKQKNVVLVGILIIVLMGLVPPWNFRIGGGERYIERPAPYGFIFSPPSYSGYVARVEIRRLLVQWVVVVFACYGFVLIFKDKS